MSRLIYAGLYRLKKDRVFWLFVIAAAAILAYISPEYIKAYEYGVQSYADYTLDRIIFELAPYSGAVAALFAALYMGREQSDGAVRCKLTVGHGRTAVYLSSYLVCLTAAECLIVLWLASSAIACVISGGRLEMGVGGFMAYSLAAMAFTASMTAAAVLVGFLFNNKAFSVTAAIVVWVCLILAASGLNDRLSSPETTGGIVYVNGDFVFQEPEPNPLYLTGTVRAVCETALHLLPTGQAILMTEAHLEKPLLCAVYSLIFTAVVLCLGLLLFKKKQIK